MEFKLGYKLWCIKSEKGKWFTVGKAYEIIDFNASDNPVVKGNNDETVDTAYGEWVYKGIIYYADEATGWKLTERQGYFIAPSFESIIKEDKMLKEKEKMITVTISINGSPIYTRSARNTIAMGTRKNKGKTRYIVDDGSTIYHKREEGAVKLAKLMLDTIKGV